MPNICYDMIRLLMYDIARDRTRVKLATQLEALGLERIQYSVFLGKVRVDDLQACLDQFAPLLEEDDRIFVLPLEKEQTQRMQMIGAAADLPYILGEQVVLFF